MKGSEYRLSHTFRALPSSFPLFLDWYRITQMLYQVKYITLLIFASWQLGKHNEMSKFDEAKLRWLDNWVRPSPNLSSCWAFPSLEWSGRNSEQGSWAAKAHSPLLVWVSRQTTHFQFEHKHPCPLKRYFR